jgi:hypothetical protein
MGFGWHCGTVFAKVGDRVLAMVLKPLRDEGMAWMQRNGYYRRFKEEETESGFTPKAVMNQIGFDY